MFKYLNLQEQQGYMVDCIIRRANGAQGIKFVVESTKHPDFIEQRIHSFLSMMTDEISGMSLEKFESLKKALKAKKLPPTTLASQFWQFYREIVIQQYHFNRTNVEASILKNITQDEVLNFYQVSLTRFKSFFLFLIALIKLQAHISPQSKGRQALSIHVLAKSSSDSDEKVSGNFRKIDELAEFKNSLQLYPISRTISLRQFYSKKHR
jgi:secreted Zn-dependent insulinase-like peptidase